VPFVGDFFRGVAAEIAHDELNHAQFLRMALGQELSLRHLEDRARLVFHPS
jgi:hypothetical protein